MRLLFLFIVLLLIAVVTRNETLPIIGRWLDVGEQPQPCDYVMLLNGDRDTRPFAVADLYQKGTASRVLITSVGGHQMTHEPPTHEVAMRILAECDVPETHVEFIDSQCDNTFDEAQTLAAFLRTHPRAKFCVVTNSYHTRRSRWVFRHVLGDEMRRVQFVSAPTDFYNAKNWWKHEDGFVAYSAELLKFGFYLCWYGNGLAWLSGIVGLVVAGWWLRRRSSLDPSGVS